ncbi:MAG: MBL fold metallo-hydrolase [Methylotenera sp.]|jgi:flavorubredoxin|uniref:MBL fold metallo-hydrolase n=1 Tax=Methylotenera sp. TaxID=2051956 RepID=UPI00248723DE|nr:MBL fold metallo-hydrolase [Methylotenera sp.]MDI1308430.1 MBL fold metallo-hydrolase [Methylotenera sp.]
MRNVKLFDSADHKFILLNESEPGEEEGIRSNQYLIQHNGVGVLCDPGGFGVMPRVLAELLRYLEPKQISGIFLSHQDPDIVGGISTWLEMTNCPVYISRIWLRFLPHYGLKDMSRFIGVPDEGMPLEVAPGFTLKIVPAHFLHSEGQINIYDPVSKILFTGDIGAAMLPLDNDDAYVDDFAGHIPYIEGFHRRYMCSNKAIRCWLETIADLEIDMIAPQHGPVYRGQAVADFLAWLKDLQCGVDIMQAGGRFV